MQTTCGVQEDHVVAVLLCMANGRLCNLDGVLLTHLEYRDSQLRTHDLQLLDCSRTVNIAGNKQRALALLFEKTCELCTVGGFTCALQADEHDNRRRFGRNGNALIFTAHQRDQLFINDLDDHLCRGQTLHHILTDAAFGNGFDKVLNNLVADVSFQKGEANLAHRFLDVGFRQATLAAKLLKRGIQFCSQSFKSHVLLLYGGNGGQNALGMQPNGGIFVMHEFFG